MLVPLQVCSTENPQLTQWVALVHHLCGSLVDRTTDYNYKVLRQCARFSNAIIMQHNMTRNLYKCNNLLLEHVVLWNFLFHFGGTLQWNEGLIANSVLFKSLSFPILLWACSLSTPHGSQNARKLHYITCIIIITLHAWGIPWHITRAFFSVQVALASSVPNYIQTAEITPQLRVNQSALHVHSLL